MKKIDDPSAVKQWGYYDARLGRGFTGTREHILVQLQEAYIAAEIPFHEHEPAALLDNYMCEQGLARPCSDSIEGLGDLVKFVLRPFAKASDKIFQTNFSTCPSCSGRQATLNHQVPL